MAKSSSIKPVAVTPSISKDASKKSKKSSSKKAAAPVPVKAASPDSSDSSSSEEEAPKPVVVEVKKSKKSKKVVAPVVVAPVVESSDSSSEEEAPVSKAVNGKKAAVVAAKEESESDSSSDEEAAPVAKVVVAPVVESSDSSSEDEAPAAKAAAPVAAAAAEESDSDDSTDSDEAVAAPASKKRAAEDEEVSAKKVKVDDVASTEVVDAAVTTVYVGGLSFSVDNEWLKSEFEVCGEVVSARVVTDRETQRSRGFGYVEFVKAESAQKALEMAGNEIDGRAIKVDLSLPRAPRDGGAFGDKPKKVFNDTLSGPPTTTLFVGNLPFSATEDAVWTAFADFGDVSSVRLPTDPESGRPKGFGYVEFSSLDAAEAAVNKGGPQATGDGVSIEGRTVRLDYSQPRADRAGGGDRGRRGGGRGGGRGGDRGGRGGRGGGRGSFGGDRGGRGGGRGGGGRGGGDSGWSSRGSARTGGAAKFEGNKKTFE